MLRQRQSLLNRATQALYAPGSTFKMVTLATALENDVADENTVYDSPGEMEIGGGKVTNFNGNALGATTLAMATVYSSNTVFAQVGVELGAEALVRRAPTSSVSTRPSTSTCRWHESVMPDPDEMTEWETAWAADGQPVGDESPTGPLATVLEMAMVGCAIANGGNIMQPYLVEGIYNANGERSFAASPHSFQQAVSSQTAERVRTVLEGVVENGTGTTRQIDGVTVAGKTARPKRASPQRRQLVCGHGARRRLRKWWWPSCWRGRGQRISDNAALKSKNVLQTALQIKGVL